MAQNTQYINKMAPGEGLPHGGGSGKSGGIWGGLGGLGGLERPLPLEAALEDGCGLSSKSPGGWMWGGALGCHSVRRNFGSSHIS